MTELRRFIAGAVCPACGGMDKLFIRSSEAQHICECVACGHRDVLDRERPPPADEPVAEPVRLIDR